MVVKHTFVFFVTSIYAGVGLLPHVAIAQSPDSGGIAQTQGGGGYQPTLQDAQNQINSSYTQQFQGADDQIRKANMGFDECRRNRNTSKINAEGETVQGLVGAGTSLMQGLNQKTFGNDNTFGHVGELIQGTGTAEKASQWNTMTGIEKEMSKGPFTKSGQLTENGTPTWSVNPNSVTNICKDKIKGDATSANEIAKEFNSQSQGSVTVVNATFTNPSSEITQSINNCRKEYDQIAKEKNSEMKSSFQKFQSASSATKQAAVTLGSVAAAGVSPGLIVLGQSLKNKTTGKLAAQELEACNQQAQFALDQANRNLSNLKTQQTNDLASLNKQWAFKAQQSKKSLAKSETPELPGKPKLSNTGSFDPSLPSGKDKNLALNNAPADASSAAPAGGGGGGGSGSGGAGSAQWGFGGAGSGGSETWKEGLPQQADIAGYETLSSGGGGGGGSGGDMSGDKMPEAPIAGVVPEEGNRAPASFEAIGDGGLEVLLARARLRYSEHAADLVKNIDVQQMAKAAEENKKNARLPASSAPAVDAAPSKAGTPDILPTK